LGRHAEFPAKVGEGLIQGLKPASLDIIKSCLNAFDGFGTVTLKKADAFHKQLARRAEVTARELVFHKLLKVFWQHLGHESGPPSPYSIASGPPRSIGPSPLQGQDDLALGVAGLEVGHRFLSLNKREHAVDHDFKLLGVDERGQIGQVGAARVHE
jgi:hypothetical protein